MLINMYIKYRLRTLILLSFKLSGATVTCSVPSSIAFYFSHFHLTIELPTTPHNFCFLATFIFALLFASFPPLHLYIVSVFPSYVFPLQLAYSLLTLNQSLSIYSFCAASTSICTQSPQFIVAHFSWFKTHLHCLFSLHFIHYFFCCWVKTSLECPALVWCYMVAERVIDVLTFS